MYFSRIRMARENIALALEYIDFDELSRLSGLSRSGLWRLRRLFVIKRSPCQKALETFITDGTVFQQQAKAAAMGATNN